MNYPRVYPEYLNIGTKKLFCRKAYSRTNVSVGHLLMIVPIDEYRQIQKLRNRQSSWMDGTCVRLCEMSEHTDI